MRVLHVLLDLLFILNFTFGAIVGVNQGKPLDIVLAFGAGYLQLDTLRDWRTLKNAISAWVASYQDETTGRTNFAVVNCAAFNSRDKIALSFRGHATADIMAQVDSAEKSRVDKGHAVSCARDIVDILFKSNFGDRPDVPNVVIWFSDCAFVRDHTDDYYVNKLTKSDRIIFVLVCLDWGGVYPPVRLQAMKKALDKWIARPAQQFHRFVDPVNFTDHLNSILPNSLNVAAESNTAVSMRSSSNVSQVSVVNSTTDTLVTDSSTDSAINETTDDNSWDANSTELGQTPGRLQRPYEDTASGSHDFVIPMIVGLLCGLVLMITLMFICLFVVARKKRNKQKNIYVRKNKKNEIAKKRRATLRGWSKQSRPKTARERSSAVATKAYEHIPETSTEKIDVNKKESKITSRPKLSTVKTERRAKPSRRPPSSTAKISRARNSSKESRENRYVTV